MIGQVKGYTNVFIFNVYLEDSHPFMLNKNNITRKSLYLFYTITLTTHLTWLHLILHFGYIILKHRCLKTFSFLYSKPNLPITSYYNNFFFLV